MPLQTQVDSSAGSYPHAEKLEYQVFPHPWERTDLVVRTVFKIAEVVARRLVGSIPTRSRHLFDSALFYAGLRGDGVFATPFTTQNRWS